MSVKSISREQELPKPATPQQSGASLGYVSEVDALRAVAAFAVVLQHCGLLPFGWMGVWLFFVISGFAITSSIKKSIAKHNPDEKPIRNFFVRRSIRIWPVYFFYVTICCVLFLAYGVPELLGNLPYLATFTYNMKMIFAPISVDHGISSVIAHLWTISVEEQFYIAFPFLFFFLTRRTFETLLILVIATGPVVRYIWSAILTLSGGDPGANAFAVYAFAPVHFDAFALGVLLALKREKLVDNLRMARQIFFLGLAAAGLYLGTYLATNMTILNATGTDILKNVVSGILWGESRQLFVYCAVIYPAAGLLALVLAREPIVIRLCNLPYLQYLGRISYGIYVYHALILFLVYPLFADMIAASTFLGRALLFVTVSALTVGAAQLSFNYLEKPVLKLRKRFA